jgi:hypothetical protein
MIDAEMLFDVFGGQNDCCPGHQTGIRGPLLLSPPTSSNYQIAMGHTDFFAQPNQLWDQNC